jgi:hypothetical protein
MDVLEKLETKSLMVYRPDDSAAFGPGAIEDGKRRLHSNATLEVPITEWLATACQWIRIECLGERERLGCGRQTVAWFRQNTGEVLFPQYGEHVPAGPAALIGEIVLTNEHCIPLLMSSSDEKRLDALRFVLAHELVHVFETMRVTVPAFMNWKAYWENALGEGLDSGDALWCKSVHCLLLDNYGTSDELKSIAEYWPASATAWFNAFRGQQLPRPNSHRRGKPKGRRGKVR